MTNELNSPLALPKRSVRFETPEHNSRPPLTTTQSALLSNLMRTHVKDRDPLIYYEVLSVVGVGSVGSVATVRKRDKVMGGSARKDTQQDKEMECFSIPVLGGIFRFCMENVNIGKSGSSQSRKKSPSDHSTDTDASSLSFRSSKRNIFSATERAPANGKYQETYAMKSIHLSRITDQAFVQELKNEIEILKQLDHPHIVRPIETFDHRNQLFIVMELCSGGDLYVRDPYTEEEAARIISSILSAVSYMHYRGVVHRDLKYENILFVNSSATAEIKLIDFGLSKIYGKSGETMTDGVGTIYTMAPEVLRGIYTSQADLWSVGVISYMLLSSQMPFYGRKHRHIVKQIIQCKYDFNGRRWKRISPQAKAFVRDLLVDDPDERATAEEAAANTWLNKRYGATGRAPTEEELDTAMTVLSSYSHYAKLKKLALMVIAHKSTSEEIGILRKVFEKYDTEKNGVITFNEFKAALEIYGYSDEELVSMFEGVDVDQTGEIKYCEFLAATIEAMGAISEERLAEAFDRLDSDDSGYISAENLRELLGSQIPQEEINAIIEEVDLNEDNQISYPEFLALWEEKNEKKREIMFEDLREHKARLTSSSEDWKSSHWEDLRDDSDSENPALARANYIEGKHLSEHRVSKLSQVSAKDVMKLLYDESDISIRTLNDDTDTDWVGYEDLMTPMEAAA